MKQQKGVKLAWKVHTVGRVNTVLLSSKRVVSSMKHIKVWLLLHRIINNCSTVFISVLNIWNYKEDIHTVLLIRVKK